MLYHSLLADCQLGRGSDCQEKGFGVEDSLPMPYTYSCHEYIQLYIRQIP